MLKIVLILSVLVTYNSGSLIEINETTFANLPALYSLDSWSRCPPPAKYCLVEATILPENSHTYQLLKNYSEQSLKHYKRTLVHRGVCLANCQTHNNLSETDALQYCVNRTLWEEHGLQAQILSISWCSSSNKALTTEERVFGILVLVLASAVLLATIYHITIVTCANIEGNKYVLAFSLKQNWSVLTYNRARPRKDERMADLACIEGLRVLAIQCVIFSHVLFVFIYSYVDNPQYIEKMYDSPVWQTTFNSPLWVQVFFSLSGCLTAYTFLVYTEKHRGSWTMIFSGVFNRWIRLTPAAVFALLFTSTWFPRLGSGPQWGRLVEREAQDCRQRWWYHALYIHNHLPLGKFCMGHTWYLAADMQLHVLGIVLLLVFYRYPRTALPVLGGLLACSAIAPALVAYFNDLMPIITAQSPESLRQLFAGSQVISQLYVPSYMNLAGYVCGMAVAYLHYMNQKHGYELNQNKLFNSIFHLSLLAGSAVVAAGSVFLHDHPPTQIAAVYAGLDRTLVAVCFNIFLLGCFSGCKSLLRSALEWRGFHALGRLSYCAFLLHFVVLRILIGSNTQLPHVSSLACMTLLITCSVLTYLVSIPVCLLVELPFLQLWKALTEKSPCVQRPQNGLPSNLCQPALPPSLVKSFDLVANVRQNGRPV